MHWMNLIADGSNWNWQDGTPYVFNQWVSGSEESPINGNCGTVGNLNFGSGFGGLALCSALKEGYVCEKIDGK